jgi:hypothetical protein
VEDKTHKALTRVFCSEWYNGDKAFMSFAKSDDQEVLVNTYTNFEAICTYAPCNDKTQTNSYNPWQGQPYKPNQMRGKIIRLLKSHLNRKEKTKADKMKSNNLKQNQIK